MSFLKPFVIILFLRRRATEWWEGNLAVTLLQVTQYAGGLLICFVYTQLRSYGRIDKTSLIIACCTGKSMQDRAMAYQVNFRTDL